MSLIQRKSGWLLSMVSAVNHGSSIKGGVPQKNNVITIKIHLVILYWDGGNWKDSANLVQIVPETSVTKYHQRFL